MGASTIGRSEKIGSRAPKEMKNYVLRNMNRGYTIFISTIGFPIKKGESVFLLSFVIFETL